MTSREYFDLLQHAANSLASGRFAQAQSACEQAARLEPESADAHSLMGLIAAQQGDPERAVTHLQVAARCAPGAPVVQNNLGVAYRDCRRFDEAMSCFRRAIEAQPDYAAAHLNLGEAHRAQGDAEAAVACYRQALTANPRLAAAHVAWGGLLRAQGELPEAANHFRQALEIQDEHGVRMQLAAVLDAMGRHQQAADLYRELAARLPRDAGVLNNLGLVLVRLGNIGEAIGCYRRAIALDPDNPVPHNSLGNALTQSGRPAAAIDAFRRSLALRADYAKAHSNLLLNMNYLDDQQEHILAESLRFDEQQARHPADGAVFANAPDANRRLRIGYVSGDFRRHSVAYFLLPLLEAHDRDRFEIFCYSNTQAPDAVTAQIRSSADHWAAIHDLPDEAAAERITQDGIDILVDLSGHTGGNRLLVFVRRSAPVQVSYLGYPNTTGLEAMDYRITDAVADPTEPEVERRYTERLVRLPGGFLCYRNDPASPPAAAVPSAGRGHVTFGSFNTLGKITDDVVRAWSALLHEVPGARLCLKAGALAYEDTRRFVAERFAEHGIGAERLDLMGPLPKAEHLGAYGRIDIALDTFPYNGTTTTCEALWMGVPVVTMRGRYHAGRVGASILQQAGLPDLVAPDPPGYLALARSLAADASFRAGLRENLRERMLKSALMNPSRLARELESAYRRIWEDWCRARSSADGR